MSEGGQGGVSPTLESALADLASLQLRVAALEARLHPFTPITPLYSLDQACLLLPARRRSLEVLLARLRATLDEPMYRLDPQHRRKRLLSHRDMLTLRAHLVRPARLRRSRRQVMQDLAAA